MRLKTKLSIAFLLVAWIPLGVVVWVLTERMEDRFAESFQDQNDNIQSAVQKRLEEVGQDLNVALGRVAELEWLRENLLDPLAAKQFYDHADSEGERYERKVQKRAEGLLTSAELDTLRLVDMRDGTVIALAHRVGVEARDTEVLALAKAQPGSVFFRYETIEKAGAVDSVWTLQVIALAGERVALVGGRIVDRGFLDSLRLGAAGAEVALDAREERVAATFPDAVPASVPGGYDVAESPLRNPGDPDPVATLRVYVSRQPIATITQELWTTAAILASVTGLLALLAGLWISRRISRPLEALSEAASDVAEGSRDPQLLELRGDDEIARLTRAFNQMTLDLSAGEERLRQSERVAAWREIARRIAHEIKNPLFPIQMSIETLKKVHERQHPDFEEIFAESTATILEEVERMKRIVTEFSNFARMPAPKPRDIDVAELVGQVLALHRDTAPGVMVVQRGAQSLNACADADQLRQAMTNLVQNGLDALLAAGPAEGALLEVRVEADGGDAFRLVVTDNGPGMDDDTRAKLFLPYFTTKAQGTGLGLAIVHRIVAEHEGTIQVDSEPGVGTRFALRLPRGGPSIIQPA